MKIKSKWKLLVFALLLVIGIGYAALSANLKIAGTSGVKSNKWIIYFDRIQNESGVVSTETKITDDKQEVDFNITLNKPGDYYEFDVDTVNDGTIDAMIDSVEFGELDDSVKDLVTFDVTYKDGTEIKKCDLLEKESRKTITVKVNYRDDITSDDLLDEDKSLNLTFTINYVQKSVCENYPSIIVDPNGGTYNGSNKLTEIKADKNSDNLLDAPEREGYEFLYFKKTDGTTLEKDENGKTNVHVENDDVKVIAQWQEDNTPRYTVTIDPNGGFYNASSSNTEVNLEEGETLTLEDPIKENYIFDGWEETTETNSLNENTVTMPAANVTVKAIWKTEADYVARINTKYYTTIQKAFDAAVTDDKVYLLKSTTENATNIKDISFDLGGFTVTGTITNSGTLTIDNGRISNTESSPFVNTGTVNVGTHDGNMIADSIVIFGGENVNGLTQNGTFNFYDGYIEGKIAVTDIYNELEEGYYYIVDHDDDNNCQKAYLSPTIDAIVKKMINNKDVYYKLLQDAVDASTNDNPNIYAINNFRDSHETTINSNQIISLDIAGYNVEEGAAIINNGTLTLKNSDTTKGSMIVRENIVNNGTLNINDISLSQGDTGKNLIENSGDLNIINSTLTATDKYALEIKNGGDLVFDNTTTITSNSYGIHNVSTEEVTITGGDIVGIFNEGNKLTVSNSNLSRSGNSYYQLYCNNGELYLNNLTTPYEYAYGIVVGWNTTKANVTGGTYVGPVVLNGDMESIVKNSNMTYLEISVTKGELINNTIRNSGAAVMSDGNLTITSGIIESTNSYALYSKYGYGNITVNGGTITGKTNGIVGGAITINDGIITSDTGAAISTSRYLTINGGTITSTSSNGVQFGNSSANITGGTIVGGNYGLYQTSGTTTIGNKETSLDITKPIIRGNLYGVYIENNANCNFYDGTLYGKTRGFYGTFSDMREKHSVFEGTETIDEELYQSAYPVVQENFLEVNNTEYNSIQDAIDAAGNEGTIKIIKNAMIIEKGIIPSTSNITLDLNGKTLLNNDTLENNGTLTILDNTQNKLGKLQSDSNSINNPIILNKGTLNIKSGNLEAYLKLITVEDSNANLKIEDGNFLSTGYYLLNLNNYKNIEISGGIFESKSIYTIIESARIEGSTTLISGGEFTNNSPYSYPNYTTAVIAPKYTTITGGTFTSTTGTGLQLSENTIVENAVVRGENNPAIKYGGGEVVINDVDAKCTNSAALSLDYYGTAALTINGGTYISENLDSFTNGRGVGVKVNGGTFKGKRYGFNGGNGITLGSNTDEAPILKPVFIGETSGANISGDVYYYDGIFKGKDSNYIGEFTDIPEDYIVTSGTETIDDEVYNTAYLDLQTPFLKVGTNTYSSLKKAINAIETTGTIEVINNGNIAYSSEIPAGKNITLDLNGYTIRTVNSITNLGTLDLKDSSGNNSGKIYNNSIKKMLINQGSLKIEGGTYESGNTSWQGGLILQNNDSADLIIDDGIFNINGASPLAQERGTLTINGGEFNSNIGITLGGNLSTINGGNIYTTVTIYGEGIINGGTIETTDRVSLSSGNGYTTITINGGYIHSSGYYAVGFRNVLNVKGGTIVSDATTAVYTEGGTLTLGTKDGTIENPHKPVIIGKTYGVYLANNQPLKFYDGIMKGQTDAFYGVINEFETDTIITYDEETDDDITLHTAYLIPQTVIVHNEEQNKDYKSLNIAFSEVEDNETLTVVDDASIYENVTIPNKKVTLDLNNHEVNFLKNVTNSGELTIKDSVSNNGYIISNRNDNNITNNSIIKLKNIEIKNKINIQNNNELYLENVTSSDLNTTLVANTENSKLEIKDSDITGNSSNGGYLIANIKGTVLLQNSIINSTNIVSNNNGTVTVNGGTMTSSGNNFYSYGDTADTAKLTVENNANLVCTYYKCSSVSNNGLSEAEIKNITLTNGGTANSSGAILKINNVTHNFPDNTRTWSIENAGELNVTGYTLNSTFGTSILLNSGTATINNINASVDFEPGSGNYYLYGISNSGTCNFNSGKIKISSSRSWIAGINNTNGTFNLKSGSIEAYKGTTVYGIYLTNGTITIGENNATVSTTDPIVTGACTNTGIGIKKTSGQVYYYDGIITGSTEAIAEAPTDIPNRYRIVLQSVPNDNNYDVRILEYVP